MADIAVFDPASATWYIAQSGSGLSLRQQPWGWRGTSPVPADYDGDLKSDLAVYDQPSGTWYIQRSGFSNTVYQAQWGGSDARALTCK